MYGRFKALKDFGEKDAEKLNNSRVAVIGLGATGSVTAEHLARHGVELLIIDRDYLEEKDVYSSNIYTPEECEKSVPKAVAAERYLKSFTQVESEVTSINSENLEVLKDVDLIIDGTDNMETRFLLNEYSKKEDVPWVYTAAIGTKGYSMLFDTKCFSCVFEEVQPGSLETCETVGVLREVSSIAASRTAEKAVRYLTDKDVSETLDTVSGKRFNVECNGCEVCEKEGFPRLSSSPSTTAVCGENKYQVERELTEEVFQRAKKQGELIAENEYVLRVRIDDRQIALFRSGRAIIKAKDRGHAESILSERLGV